MLTIKKRAGKSVILFLALATLFTGCTPRGQRALLDGKKLMERGHYDEAIAQLRLATSLIGTNAATWNYLGMAYHHAGQTTNAVQAYRRALDIDHDLMEAHYNLGCLWLEENRLDAAKAELTAYTLRREHSAEGWLKLGTAQLRSREWAAAEKSLTEAQRADPQNAEVLNGLGVILVQRNRPRDAAQFFSNALKQRPEYPPALLNLAIVSQLYLNNRSQALEKYEEYLASPTRNEANREAVNAIAHALEQEVAAASRSAAANAGRANASAPAKTSNYVIRADWSTRPEPTSGSARTAPATPSANPDAVRSVPDPAPRSAPPAPDASARPPAAPAAARRDPKPTPAPSAANASRVETPKAAANTVAASSVQRYRYHAVGELTPGDHAAAEIAVAHGVQAQRANRLPEAIQAYQQAVQLDPAYYDAYFDLGVAFSAAGNLPQALLAYETALAIQPDSTDARYNFALALKQANFFTDSAAELDKLLAAHPNEPRAHLALGNLCAQQLQQPGRAREHYLKVLEIDPRNSQASAIRYWLQANPP